MGPARLLGAMSALMLALRLYAATRVGFGDSEALYASYALHPQAAYLDHPCLVGILARAIGGGGAPTPMAAHLVTSVLATLVPWLGLVAARAAGAKPARATIAAIALACVPEIAVGLFALTPDLLLAVGWLGALALAAWGLRAEPRSTRSQMSLLGAGLVAGASCVAKVTALALVAALALSYAAPKARTRERGIWPWAGLVSGLVVFAPIVLFEAHLGWPMLRHRLVDTQAGAGPTASNVAAIVFGQLAYLSPLLAVLAAVVLRGAWRARAHAIGSASSGGAAPSPVSRRFGVAACATGLAMSLAAHAWVLVSPLARLLPASFDPRWDIASELFGWPEVVAAVRELPLPSGAESTAIVGPHWVVCAQLHAALGPRVPVGCATPIRDDFDDWFPRPAWQRAETVVFVTDTRFDVDPTSLLPLHGLVTHRTVPIDRGGRTMRVFTLSVFDRRSQTLLDRPKETLNP
jgi:hypothetical protein